jgi:6-phosphogluconolactonase
MIRVHADPEGVSAAAARLFAGEARRAAARHGRFSVLLAGGDTPRRFYELLGQMPFAGRIPWEQVHVFWGDERCVPEGDPRSNADMARRAFLDRVHVPRGQVHPIRCDRSSVEGATAYEAALRAFFGPELPRFDLVLLGLGTNGHTASLFPGTDVLAEREHWAAEVTVPGEPFARVTVTLPVINAAASIAFLVTGSAKGAVLREILEGNPDPRQFPARLVRPTAGRLFWLVDEEAAGLLVRR